MATVPLQVAADLILACLYRDSVMSNLREGSWSSQLHSLVHASIAVAWLSRAVDILLERGFVEVQLNKPTQGDRFVRITNAGIIEVEKQLEDQNSVCAQALNGGPDGIEKIVSGRTTIVTPLKFTTFRDQLLIALADRQTGNPGSYFDLGDIAQQASLRYETGWPRLAATWARDHGYVNGAFTMGGGPDGGLNASITADGLEYVENLDDHLKATIATQQQTSVPAADRVVPLNHNSASYKEATTKLDNLITAIETNNEFAASEPEVQKQVLSELNAGKALLNSPQASIGKLHAVFYGTAIYLAEKFADAPIGEMAHALWSAIKALIGL